MSSGRQRLFLLLAAYAILAAVATLKDNLTYRYGIYFIQDWHFGFIKRGLAGEFFHLIYHPPYSIAQYRVIAMALLLTETALIAIFALCSGISWDRKDWALFWAFVFTSPLAVKYLAFDYGRSDQYGLAALLLVALAYIQGRRGLGAVLAAVSLPVIALINENTLLLFGPALCFLSIVFGGEPRGRGALVPFIVLLACFGLVLIIPSPSVPYAEFRNYYQSISVDGLGRENLTPFLGIRDAIVQSFHERQWTVRLQPEQAVSYLSFLAPALFVLWKLGSGAASIGPRQQGRQFAVGLAVLVLAYGTLYIIATDWDRWTEDLLLVVAIIICCRLFHLRAGPRLDAPTRSLLALGIAGQVFIFRGFGIWNPILEMADSSGFTWLAAAALVATVFFALARPDAGRASTPVLQRMAAWLAMAAFGSSAVIFLALRGPEALGGYPTSALGCTIWAAASLAAAMLFAHRALARPTAHQATHIVLTVLYLFISNLAATPHLTGLMAHWPVPVALTAAEAAGLWALSRRGFERSGLDADSGGVGRLGAAAALGLLVGFCSFPTLAWQALERSLKTAPAATEFYFEPGAGPRWGIADLLHSPALSLQHLRPWVSAAPDSGRFALFPLLLLVLMGMSALMMAGPIAWQRRFSAPSCVVAVFLIGLCLGHLLGGDLGGFLAYFSIAAVITSALAFRALGEGEAQDQAAFGWSTALGIAAALQVVVALLWGLGFAYEARGQEPLAGSKAYFATKALFVKPPRSDAAAAPAVPLMPRHSFLGNGVAADYFGSRYRIDGLAGFMPLPGSGFYSLERRFRYLKPGLEPLAIFVPSPGQSKEPANVALVVAAPQYGEKISAEDYSQAVGWAVRNLSTARVPTVPVPGEDTVLGASLTEGSVLLVKHMAPPSAEFFDGLYQERVLRIDDRLLYVYLFAPRRDTRDQLLEAAQTAALSQYLGSRPISVSKIPDWETPAPPSWENLQIWLRYGSSEIPTPLLW